MFVIGVTALLVACGSNSSSSATDSDTSCAPEMIEGRAEWSKGDTDLPPDEADRRWRTELGGRLIAFVAINNVSEAPCLFPEWPAVEILGDRDERLPLTFTKPSGALRARTIAPGRPRNLRLYWNGPYCGPVPTVQRLSIGLDGGRESVPVASPMTPPCFGDEGETVRDGDVQVYGIDPVSGED